MITSIKIAEGRRSVTTQLVHKTPIFYSSSEREAWELEMEQERNAWEEWKQNSNRCTGISDISNNQTSNSSSTSNSTQLDGSTINEASFYDYENLIFFILCANKILFTYSN